MQNVLDSLIPALLADKNRKFIYVEQVSIYTQVTSIYCVDTCTRNCILMLVNFVKKI